MLENDYLLRADTPQLRDELCLFFEEKYGKIRFFEEKNIGKARADMLAVLESGIAGIEIKSHADSYERLAAQIKEYNKFCDLCWLAVGSRHKHADEHVPPHWGIIKINVRDGASFEILREATTNPKCKLEKQLSIMWHNELSEILKECSLPRYAQKSKKFICERLLVKVKPDKLKKLICERLFERDYTKYE